MLKYCCSISNTTAMDELLSSFLHIIRPTNFLSLIRMAAIYENAPIFLCITSKRFKFLSTFFIQSYLRYCVFKILLKTHTLLSKILKEGHIKSMRTHWRTCMKRLIQWTRGKWYAETVVFGAPFSLTTTLRIQREVNNSRCINQNVENGDFYIV